MKGRNWVAGVVALVGLACCTVTSSEEGLSVGVGLAAEPPTTTTFTTDLGYEITLTKGFVAVATTTIRACTEGTSAAATRRGGLIDALVAPLAIRSAWAHSTTSPTELGVPGVLPLVPTSSIDADLGELRPPPAHYCTTRVALGPADRDAEMLPDPSMVGLTLAVEGTWSRAGTEPVAFAWSSSATPSAEHETPFELAEDGTRAVQEVLWFSFERMFDGIDVATIDPALGADRAAARLVETLSIELR